MTARTLSYADVVQADPLPALRRLRTLSLVWSIAVLLNSTVFIAGLLLWPGRGYQPGEYYPSYFERSYWYLDLVQPTAAVLLLAAVCAWVGRLDRRRVLVLFAAVSSAAILVANWVWYIVMARPPGPAKPIELFVGFVQTATVATMPATLAFAAFNPSRFGASRLASAAGLAMAFLAAMFAHSMTVFGSSLLTLPSSDFWPYLSSWWLQILIVLYALTAAALFLVGAIQLRHGGGAKAARIASWIVLASILAWPIASAMQYLDSYYWLDAPSTITWCLMTQCLGLAFLRPLRSRGV